MSGERRPGLRAVRAAAAALLALFGTACVPMDNVMQTIFKRSMRSSASVDPYEMTLMPPDGAVSFSSGNHPAVAGEVNLGDPNGVSPDVPPITPADMATGGGVAAGLVNPVPATPASLERGKVVYDRGCAICHGPAGNPQEAPILPKFPAMVAFPLASGGALLRTDGYIFGMITAGRGIMPAYGHQIAYYDRWNVVNYVRQLQGRLATPAAPAGEG
jgi:mono/diheme cytochrome c family protein